MVLFLGVLNIRCRTIIGIQKGTIILTTTHKASPTRTTRFVCGQESQQLGNVGFPRIGLKFIGFWSLRFKVFSLGAIWVLGREPFLLIGSRV